MLATLTSHHNLVHAGACVYDPEQSRVKQGYRDLFLTVFQVPLHISMEELLKVAIAPEGSSNWCNQLDKGLRSSSPD